ncbi:MAG TPA: UDP-N-acetylmuramate--L-alanine ligase [Bacteroidales bacterium]|nr:UDP-N-acetylmuramate--L-alanine ligase [Bacteroidales bacterium]
MENKYTHIYFLGIGGIGMSALAQYFHAEGYKIAGYDRFRSDICIMLEGLGINIHYDDDIKKIPLDFTNSDNTQVILTPAIHEENSELTFFRKKNFCISKRAEILGMISNPKKGLAIAGTHGKTSVSGICANIMSLSENSCSAFLGGISKNINSNIIINTNSDYVVVEADEFDRSFHKLNPSTALVTYIDSDHLDIYKNHDSLKDAFIVFCNQVKNGGNIILNTKIYDEIKPQLRKDLNVFKYGIDESGCDFYIDNIKYHNEYCYFDIHHPQGIIKSIKYSIGGNHNLENALAASSIALINGAKGKDVRLGLESFQGIVRRFDIRIKSSEIIYIDDYAHHPNEISAFLTSVRSIYKNKEITGVFQPHLYSRTADFYYEFAESLSICDEIILLPIYPAREKPIKGVNSEMILKLIKKERKHLCKKEELLSKLKKLNPELLVTMGAGDIDQFVKPIIKLFSK